MPIAVSRRQFNAALGAGAAALAGLSRVSRAATQRRTPPNIILVMADDLSARDLECYGHPDNATLRMNDMARNGALFQTCWATPICSPSRAQIMTGRYGFRTGWFHNNLKTNIPLTQDHPTLPQVLKAAGYVTAVTGKWQLPGSCRSYGFDEDCMWIGMLGKHTWFDGPVEQKGATLPGRAARYWHPAIVRNGEPLKTGPEDYGPDLFVDFIQDFAGRHRTGPFFVYYSMCLTHMSWDFERQRNGYLPTPKLDADGRRVPGRSAPTLQANVRYTDYLMGRIADGLKELGLLDTTVLLFTGDNGTAGYGKGHTDQERGPRVPLVVYGPGTVKPIGKTDALVQFADILPTLADVAGATLPDDTPVDGHSFAPLLKGEPFERREWIFSYYADTRFLRTDRFLLDGNGKLWDCGEQRNEDGYVDVTTSDDPAAVQARRLFDELLAQLPGPDPQSPEYKAYQDWREQQRAARQRRRRQQ